MEFKITKTSETLQCDLMIVSKVLENRQPFINGRPYQQHQPTFQKCLQFIFSNFQSVPYTSPTLTASVLGPIEANKEIKVKLEIGNMPKATVNYRMKCQASASSSISLPISVYFNRQANSRFIFPYPYSAELYCLYDSALFGLVHGGCKFSKVIKSSTKIKCFH